MPDYEFRRQVAPADMIDAFDDYIRHGRQHGDFVMAVLENDLARAVSHADSRNVHALAAFAGYLFNECPRGCWGSNKRVTDWLANVDGVRDRATTGWQTWREKNGEEPAPETHAVVVEGRPDGPRRISLVGQPLAWHALCQPLVDELCVIVWVCADQAKQVFGIDLQMPSQLSVRFDQILSSVVVEEVADDDDR